MQMRLLNTYLLFTVLNILIQCNTSQMRVYAFTPVLLKQSKAFQFESENAKARMHAISSDWCYTITKCLTKYCLDARPGSEH